MSVKYLLDENIDISVIRAVYSALMQFLFLAKLS